MKISFRQGIISHQSGGSPFYLNQSGSVSIMASNKPLLMTIAHKKSNYTYSEDFQVDSAWVGPFLPNKRYWLYFDFNPMTFQRTFGITDIEPIVQSVSPGLTDIHILSAVSGAAGVGHVTVTGEYQFQTGRPMVIYGSTTNDGTYTVSGTTYNSLDNYTVITFNESLPDSGSSGFITLNRDSAGKPLRISGRHWFDTASTTMKVYNGSTWLETIRIFACSVVNSNNIVSMSMNAGSFVGTQVGNTSVGRSGRIVFSEDGSALIRDDGTFYTSEDQFIINGSKSDAFRLESSVARVQSYNEPNIAAYTVVSLVGSGKAKTAEYNDVSETIVAILTEDMTSNSVSTIVFDGVVTNSNWNWLDSDIGKPLWVGDIDNSNSHNNNLTKIDPHVVDPVRYRIGKVPVARILSSDSIIFSQGLGGKGDRGPVGSITDIPKATNIEVGGVLLSRPAADSNYPIVVGDNDIRLSDSRHPLPHTHNSLDITLNPISGLNSTTIDGALTELNNTKLSTSGGTIVGTLTIQTAPQSPYNVVNKLYVDGLVSGLIWVDPVCLINLISDNIQSPPTSPEISDTYIIPYAPSGAWSAIQQNHAVMWDGTVWVDLGHVSTLDAVNQVRLGIAMSSPTQPSGTFSNNKNNIALFDSAGVFVGFQIPIKNNAFYVCSDLSMHAFNQFAYDGISKWVLFGGTKAIQVDNTTIIQTGNVLSVKQYEDGGQVNASLWRGMIPSDLSQIYSNISHVHSASNTTSSQYQPNQYWGVPVDSSSISLTSSDVQSALLELVDKKASKTPKYSLISDLPDPYDTGGMLAYVDDTSSVYYASYGDWVELARADHTHTIPYDITFYIAGPAAIYTNKTIGVFVSPRYITVTASPSPSLQIDNVFVRALTAPSSDVTFNIVLNETTVVGTIVVSSGWQVQTNNNPITQTFTLHPRDRLSIVTTSIGESNISDVAITIVGCSPLSTCPTTYMLV